MTSFPEASKQEQRQRILVTGASGFVGSRLINSKNERAQAMQFRAITRRSHKWVSGNVEEFLLPDISADTDWSDALSGIETIVHLAARVHVMNDKVNDPLKEYRATNVAATLNLANQAAKAGVKRFIFLSSIKVNGESTKPGAAFNEMNIPAPQDPYGISKLEAEEGLRKICEKSSMEFVFIRPPLIYGPGVKANYLKLMQLIQKRIPLPLGAIVCKRSMLAVDNLIDFIFLSSKNPKAANQLFLLADSETLTLRQLISQIASSFGYSSARLIAIPVALLKMIGCCLGKTAAIGRLTESLEVDSRKARNLLDWNPPLAPQEAIALTVEDYVMSSKADIK